MQTALRLFLELLQRFMSPFVHNSGKCLYFRESVNVALSPRNVQALNCVLVCRTEHSDTNNKSDVWLTVHRNSVWIRKTN